MATDYSDQAGMPDLLGGGSSADLVYPPHIFVASFVVSFVDKGVDNILLAVNRRGLLSEIKAND